MGYLKWSEFSRCLRSRFPLMLKTRPLRPLPLFPLLTPRLQPMLTTLTQVLHCPGLLVPVTTAL